MQIELTEEDICGYDEGDDVECGNVIVFESKNGVSDNIKEMRCLKSNEKNIDISSDMRVKLDNIERELLSLEMEDKSESLSKRYTQVKTLYKKIHDAYHNINNNSSSSCIESDDMKDCIDTTTGIKLNSDLLDYVSMQRLTKLEQRLSVLEESIGFDSYSDNESNNDTTLNIVARINRLYAHLGFIKNQLDKEGGNINVNINIQDIKDKNTTNTIKSFDKINKYSSYMDHIITRLENYSSIYDDMIENNVRLQQWDNKIEILVEQQKKWIELLDKIDKKLESDK